MDLKFGRVIWFNRMKGFGFARPDGEDIEVFFHFGNGRSMEIKNSEIVFSELDVPIDFPYPKTGDYICFLIAEGSKGRLKCSPWSFTSKFKIADDCQKKHKLTDIDVFGLELCPDCGHTMFEHNDGASPCQVYGCHCGDESWEDEEETFHEVWLSDSPMGTIIYE